VRREISRVARQRRARPLVEGHGQNGSLATTAADDGDQAQKDKRHQPGGVASGSRRDVDT
jgi:hypothetical protein